MNIKVPEGVITIPAIAEDGTLYPVEKLKAHVDALFHLAVSVFVFDGDHLLIQQRAADKYHCGGQWANTCCTHPHWGENLQVCAERRLQEELGFSLPLTEMRVEEYSADVGNGLHEHERVTLYRGEADKELLRVRPNQSEVSQTRWITAEELKLEMANRPEAFTPWLHIYLNRFPNLVL